MIFKMLYIFNRKEGDDVLHWRVRKVDVVEKKVRKVYNRVEMMVKMELCLSTLPANSSHIKVRI